VNAVTAAIRRLLRHRARATSGTHSRTRAWVFGFTAFVLIAAILLAGGCGGSDNPKVTLQLNWFNEAEFAGYYMADAQGFYTEQGLDVTILEGGPGTPARDQVLNGAATFGITSFAEQRTLVTDEQPVVAVMSAFQIPPLVIFSLEKEGIVEPADLVGRRVGVTTDYWMNVLEETLTAAGVDTSQVTRVDVEPLQMNMLYDGRVDAWLGYAQDEPIKAQIAGYPVTNIFPADFGVGGYEGLVITLQKTIETNPELVRRFVKASYDGWRYAVEHPDEAAEVLLKWAPDNTLEFHKLAVRSVAPLVDTPQVPVGWIDRGRWEQLMGDDWNPARPGFTMGFSPVQPAP
jgi:ABC-type nitrate/sulfonate/bicarbonate transport system substrate-binding protein